MEDKYLMLKCIDDCPDTFVSDVVIFNVIKWNFAKIDNILDVLLQEKLIKSVIFSDTKHYTLTYLGKQYLEKYPKTQKQDNFNKYIFPILISIATTLLGLLITILINLLSK